MLMTNTRRGLRGAAAILALAVLGYGGALGWLVAQETQLVFRAGRPLGVGRPAFAFEEVRLPRADAARQFGWVMKAEAAAADAPWVLYFHGNAATIASRGNLARYGQLHGMGLHVLAPEYRGFGGLDGEPSETSLGWTPGPRTTICGKTSRSRQNASSSSDGRWDLLSRSALLRKFRRRQ